MNRSPPESPMCRSHNRSSLRQVLSLFSGKKAYLLFSPCLTRTAYGSGITVRLVLTGGHTLHMYVNMRNLNECDVRSAALSLSCFSIQTVVAMSQSSGAKLNRQQYLKRYQKLYRMERKRLELTLTPDEHQTLQDAAKRHKKKLSTFTKEAALAYLNQEFIVPDEEHLQRIELGIRRIGINLNQLVRRAHQSGIQPDTVAQLEELVRQLEQSVGDSLRHPLVHKTKPNS